ncbi:tail fiber domain-containing protein [Candidatus Woesearchaeota archaeon]|nr:tail fiber domain-containing protein [Candidatus Woesearchaeota archaeon]
MKEICKEYEKALKENWFFNKVSKLDNYLSSFLKFSLAIAMLIFLIIAVNAGDVIVKNGELNITNDLLVNTNTLFVNSTSNRIGIGTSSPTTPLHIDAGSSTEGPVLTLENNAASAGDAISLGFNITGGTPIGEIVYELIDGDPNRQMHFYVADGSNSLKRIMTLGGSPVSVGIGAIPTAMLHIENSSAISIPYLNISDATNTIFIVNSDNSMGIGKSVGIGTSQISGINSTLSVEGGANNKGLLAVYASSGPGSNYTFATYGGSETDNSAPTFFITRDPGNVGISSFSQVGSDGMCWDGSGASVIGDCTSLLEYKNNISNLTMTTNLWNKYMLLQPISYYWNNLEWEQNLQVGFIAEDLKKINPILADYADVYNETTNTTTSELTGVNFQALTTANVMAIQSMALEMCEKAPELNFSWC